MTLTTTLKWLMYLALLAFMIRISVLLVYKMENQFMAPTLPADSILVGSNWVNLVAIEVSALLSKMEAKFLFSIESIFQTIR